jgi:ABC-type lipoprotein release transport system permease subunit
MLRRAILNATLTAVCLGLIGYILAHAAGLWTSSQSTREAAEFGESVTNTLLPTLPLTLAAGGFAFVLLGEFLLGLWRGKEACPPG